MCFVVITIRRYSPFRRKEKKSQRLVTEGMESVDGKDDKGLLKKLRGSWEEFGRKERMGRRK